MGKRKFKVKRSLAGLGLFATEKISKNDFIVEYIGEKLTSSQADGHRGKYLFKINENLFVDGKGRDNPARYANHSCRPNAKVTIYAQKIRIKALENIGPGEEITYDYGEEYFKEYIEPSGCKCAHCAEKKTRR